MSATFRFYGAREPGALWRRAFLSQSRSVSLVVLRVAGAGQNGAYFTAEMKMELFPFISSDVIAAADAVITMYVTRVTLFSCYFESLT